MAHSIMTPNGEHAEMLALLKHARLNNCLGQAYLLAGDDGDFLKQFVKEWMKIAARRWLL